MTIYKLGDIGEFKGGISKINKKRYDNGIRFVNYMDVFNNSYIDEKIQLRKYDATKSEVKRYLLNYGDALFTASSETPNEIATSSIYLSNEIAIFNGFCKRFRYDKSILIPKFASFLFRCEKFRNIAKGYAKGFTRFNISQKDLMDIEVSIPPPNIQKQIIDIIEPHEKLFLKYSSCVRISNPTHTKNDIETLKSIMNPIDRMENKIKKSIDLLKLMEDFLFHNILKKSRVVKVKELIIEKKKNRKFEPQKIVSIGYYGIKNKVGKIPVKSKILSRWDFVIGLISKNIPKALNIKDLTLGVSSAYKVFGSVDEIISKSWFCYRILEETWKKYIKPTSRQGQGFDSFAFLNEIVSSPSNDKFTQIEPLIKKILTLKNSNEKFYEKIKKIRENIVYNLER